MTRVSLRTTHYYLTLAIDYGRFSHYGIHCNVSPKWYLIQSDRMQKRVCAETEVTDANGSFEPSNSRPQLSYGVSTSVVRMFARELISIKTLEIDRLTKKNDDTIS